MTEQANVVRLRLLSKPGCHLCDEARLVVERVRVALAPRIATSLEEQNILEQPELARRFAEDIPVLFVNGRQQSIWKVDETKLTAAIEKAAKKPWRFDR